MDRPGEKLRRVRERLKLTYRDVEQVSQEIAARHSNLDYTISLSRLADIENNGRTPTVYRFYSLCAIYHLDLHEVLVSLDWKTGLCFPFSVLGRWYSLMKAAAELRVVAGAMSSIARFTSWSAGKDSSAVGVRWHPAASPYSRIPPRRNALESFNILARSTWLAKWSAW